MRCIYLCYQLCKVYVIKMEKVTLTLIHDRLKRGTSQKPVSVEIRFTCNRKRKYVSTGILITPSQWSPAHRVIRHKNADELNRTLDVLYKRAEEVCYKMNSEKIFDLSRVDELLRGEDSKSMKFADYCEKRMQERKVCEHTKKRYAVFIRFLRAWDRIISFSDCNVAKVREMDEYLTKQGKAQSTIYDYHKYLKLFIHDAVIDGLVEKSPYEYLPFTIGRGEKQYVDCINEEQFNKIKDLDISVPHISQARDLFLFQCYTGMAYSDLMSFEYADCDEVNGKMFYHSKRTKTDTDFVFQLLDPALEILKKYKYRLPKISNQKYNDYLKVVGMMVGVERLHSHMGRATAATLFLSKGMPINIVARVLGHTTLRQTTRYARTLNKDVMGAFDSIEGKL